MLTISSFVLASWDYVVPAEEVTAVAAAVEELGTALTAAVALSKA